MGELEERLEAIYTTIQKERMADIPILNPRLQVRAVGFREWEGHRLGVLVTPWFMNILLLPGEDGEWSTLACGEKVTQRLPSGVYEFIVGEEVDLGHYQMCSLFSPMFEFEDQAAALATARAVMDGVLDEFMDVLKEHDIEVIRADVNERLSEEELLPLIADIDGVICGDDRFTDKVMDAAPKLKVLAKWGTGIDSIPSLSNSWPYHSS